VSEEPNRGRPLTEEIGTSTTKRARGEIDRRLSSNIDADDIEWLIFCRLGKELGIKPMEIASDEFLHDALSVDALGLRYIIKGESARQGVAPSTDADIPQHNRVSKAVRSLINPNWEQEERQKLGLNE
jgi:hypothetical protein